MTSKSSPNVGIYFSHYECLGHTSRVMAVGEVFRKSYPQGELFFIQAGVKQPKVKLRQLGPVYTLPDAFMDRRNFREPVRLTADSLKRAMTCLDIISCQKPTLLITEFFPLGREECRHELIPALSLAAKHRTAIWAVAGYPLLTGKDNDWREQLMKFYQKIIIFSPAIEKEYIASLMVNTQERKQYLDFFKKHKQKIIFAGYLLSHQKPVAGDKDKIILQSAETGNVCQVAVLRGGGAFYPKLIAQAIRSSDLLGAGYYLTVIAGPSTTQEEWDFFASLMDKKRVNNLALHRAISYYEELIRKSDVCVSVGSYHTSVMLLKYSKKAVIIPFEGYGSMTFHEQVARARMLKETIGADILSMKDLTAKSLAAAIKDAASRGRITSKVPADWFKGEAVLTKSLTGLFGQ